jgi:hypothetical protein
VLPLPIEKVHAAMPDLVAALRPDGFEDLARAIMTTDTVPKLSRARHAGRTRIHDSGRGQGGRHDPSRYGHHALFRVHRCIRTGRNVLQIMLRPAVERSLNRITIDGDTSTNDTVLLMANGVSGAVVRTAVPAGVFQAVLDDVLMDIARRLVKDGEGVTKVVEIKVQGARPMGMPCGSPTPWPTRPWSRRLFSARMPIGAEYWLPRGAPAWRSIPNAWTSFSIRCKWSGAGKGAAGRRSRGHGGDETTGIFRDHRLAPGPGARPLC